MYFGDSFLWVTHVASPPNGRALSKNGVKTVVFIGCNVGENPTLGSIAEFSGLTIVANENLTLMHRPAFGYSTVAGISDTTAKPTRLGRLLGWKEFRTRSDNPVPPAPMQRETIGNKL
jgi:hypothetical protein